MATQAIKQKAQSEPIALFVSDLHLQPSHPKTTQAFFDFLHLHACKVRQLYLLGDLFESWVGDDDIVDPYNAGVINALRQVSDAGVDVFWMGGNRDFLVGEDFVKAAGLMALPDLFVITIAGQRILLAHGDAQCTDDLPYMTFRNRVRQSSWQKQFLGMPLAQRKAIVADMRVDSRQAQESKSYDIMDVNSEAIKALFVDTRSEVLIHGHTHRPGYHLHEVGGARPASRYVLPDWECDAMPTRGGWIEVTSDGEIRRVGLDGQSLAFP